MKKHINLLLKKKEYVKKERFFHYFRIITLLMSIFVFLITLVFFFLNKNLQKKRARLLDKKTDYLNKIIKKKDVETKLTYLANQTDQLKKLSQEDVKFLKYYQIIKETVAAADKGNVATGTGILIDNFNLDNKRNTQFSIITPDFNTYIKMLSYIETERFLSLFSQITLVGFSFKNEGVNGKGYTLKFKGKFSPQYEKTN